MRGLLAAVLAAGLLWGGYWVLGAHTLQTQIEAWLAGEAAAGVDIGRQDLSVAGFPNRFDVTVTGPHLRQAGWGWRADFLQVFSMTWKPWHVIAVLPPVQTIATPDGQSLTLASQGLRGSLRLHPGLDLGLDAAVIEASTLRLTSDRGWAWGLGRVVLAAAQDPSWTHGIRLGIEASDLEPDPAAAAQVPDLGAKLSSVHLDASVQLTAPVDRHLRGPVGVLALRLAEAHVTWGPLVISARGNLTRGADGRAEGEVSLSVAHWQRLPDALVALGLLPQASQALVTRALTLLAAQVSDPDRLETVLTMAQGRMALGALPLGGAPVLP